jgi:hypothetical protein
MNFVPAENQPRDLIQVRRLRRDALFASVQRLASNSVHGRQTIYDAPAVNAAVGDLIDAETEIVRARYNPTTPNA